MTPQPSSPAPPASPRAPPWDVTLPPPPALPGGWPGPWDCHRPDWVGGALPRGDARRPGSHLCARPRGAHFPPRPIPRAARLPLPHALTAGSGGCRIGDALRRGKRRDGSGREPERAGPRECRRPARLPLNLSRAAGHSLHRAPPPPHRSPRKFPTSDSQPLAPPRPLNLGSVTSLPPYPGPAPTCAAGAQPSLASWHASWVGGTSPGESAGRGTGAGPKPLLPSLEASVGRLSPTKPAPGGLARPAFTAGPLHPRRAGHAVAREPAGPCTRRGSEWTPTMRAGTAPRPPALLLLLQLVLLVAAPTAGKVSARRGDPHPASPDRPAPPRGRCPSPSAGGCGDCGRQADTWGGGAAWGRGQAGMHGNRWHVRGWRKGRGGGLEGSLGVRDGESPPEVDR